MAATLDVTLREIKIALLRLARCQGRNYIDYIDTAYGACEECGAETAVVRLGRRARLRLIA